MRCSASGGTISARSVMRPRRGGTSRARASAGRNPMKRSAPRKNQSRAGLGKKLISEVDLRRFLELRGGLERGTDGLVAKPGTAGGGEALDDLVVLGHGLDIALARDRDAVLGAFDLRLQVAELRARLELRIALGHDQEARERTAELLLRLIELLEALWIVHDRAVHLDARRLRARLDHLLERFLLEARGTLHDLHEIRNEVAPSLVLVLDLCPSGLDVFVTLDDLVVAAARGQDGERHEGEEEQQAPGNDESEERGRESVSVHERTA